MRARIPGSGPGRQAAVMDGPPPAPARRPAEAPRGRPAAGEAPDPEAPGPYPAIPVFSPAPHSGTTTLPPTASPPPRTAAQQATPVVST
ncbi:hypothetical protein A3Q37_07096 [Streptomyces sp. PTY087I2]|nr:hypothetical protein A3Q37_07096 [Streptomyces sp. PTY087I2]